MISSFTFQLVWQTLKQYRGALIWGVVALACGAVMGWFVHERVAQSEIYRLNKEVVTLNRQLLQHETDKRLSAEQQINALTATLSQWQLAQKRSHALEQQLLQTQQQLNQTKQQLQERVDDAITRDGDVNGLGAHSLQLYRDALGYTVDGNRYVP